MKALLSDSFVRRLQGTAERRYEVWDSQCRGLVLTVSASGVKSYSVRYRVDGRSVRVTLGRYPAVKAAAARKRAFALLAKASEGIDPRYGPKRRNNSLLFDEAVEMPGDRRRTALFDATDKRADLLSGYGGEWPLTKDRQELGVETPQRLVTSRRLDAAPREEPLRSLTYAPSTNGRSMRI